MDDAGARLDAAVDRLATLTAGRARTGRGHDDADDVEGSLATDVAGGATVPASAGESVRPDGAGTR